MQVEFLKEIAERSGNRITVVTFSYMETENH